MKGVIIIVCLVISLLTFQSSDLNTSSVTYNIGWPIYNSTIPGLSYEEPENALYILGYYTMDSRHPYYYVPDNDCVNELTNLINDLDKLECTPGWWEGLHPLLGCYLVYEDMMWEVWSNGIVVSRIAGGVYAEAPELNERILVLMRDMLDITPFEPNTIQGVVAARLDVQFIHSSRKYTQTVTDTTSLASIEALLSDAGRSDMSACPFYEAFMTLSLANGEEIFLALASDSCCEYMVNGQGFNFKPSELRFLEDSGGNEILFQYFDQIPMASRGEN